MVEYAIEKSMNGKATSWGDAFANGGLQLLSGTFAFGAGILMGASGYYNTPRITKFLSKQWFANIAFGQFIKFITYYPFNWSFNLFKKTYFRGE